MKILIVDDEPLVRRALEKAFGRKGHEVFMASDGDEGLELWKSNQLDIVILDVLMPGLTGPEVLDAIGVKYGKSLNILISAYTGEYKDAPFHHSKVDHFFSKPFENIFSIVDDCELLWGKKFK